MAANNLITLKAGSGTMATLVWLPHAGGSAAFFQELSNALPDMIDCRAAEYPGRGRRFREPLCGDLMIIAREVAASLATLPEDKPIILFGHSLGARIGFEVCRQLRLSKAKASPRLMAVSACEPLHVPRVLPLFHKLLDDALLDKLIALGAQAAISGLARELLLANLKVIRADLALGETHYFSPLPLLDQDLAVYSGRQDSIVRQSVLAHWQRLSDGATSFRDFEGGHFYMLERSTEFLARLAQDIRGVVERMPQDAPA